MGRQGFAVYLSGAAGGANTFADLENDASEAVLVDVYFLLLRYLAKLAVKGEREKERTAVSERPVCSSLLFEATVRIPDIGEMLREVYCYPSTVQLCLSVCRHGGKKTKGALQNRIEGERE